MLIAQHGAIRYEKAFGSACLELGTPLAPSMLFDLGSITKQFTAVAILQLAEQGKLRLTDSIQRFVAGFPGRGYTITIENLLTHTSGIVDYMQLDEADPYLIRKDFTVREIIDTLESRPLAFAPGTQFQYSNSGYFLLGYIIEKATGQRYGQYLAEHLFSPLGLHHTYFRLPNEVIPGHVYGYQSDSSGFAKADFWSATLPYAAGGLVSNVEDLYRWHVGLLSGKVLTAASVKKAMTPYALANGASTGYGYGFYISGQDGTLQVGHGGAISGFRTNEVYFPAAELYIAILGNRDNLPVDDLSLTAAGIVEGKPLQPDLALPDSLLRAYTGTYYLVGNTQRTIEIRRNGDRLVAAVKGQGDFSLLFSGPRTFDFKAVQDAKGEFVWVAGRVTGFAVEQHGRYFWQRKE